VPTPISSNLSVHCKLRCGCVIASNESAQPARSG
jgi:hypothetical protein